MLKTVLKWSAIVVGGLLLLLVLAAATLYMMGRSAINATYDIRPAVLTIPSDSTALARGAHLVATQACADCHGENMGGKPFFDNGAMGYMAAPNLTRGKGGIGADYTDADWQRAIVHGVNRQGRSLLMMPSAVYAELSDADLAAMIAWLKQLPPVDRAFPERDLGPIPHFVSAFNDGMLAASGVDHDAARVADVVPAVSVEYGAYLANTCRGCHGNDLVGGAVHGPPGTPPAANISPDPEQGVGTWSEADFVRAMREGIRPDGTEISPAMPRLLGQLTDDELKALWLYLRSVPPAQRDMAEK